jgi:hypothetical protein
MTTSNAEQIAGYMIGDILGICILDAFTTMAAGDPGAGHSDDYRKMMRSNVCRAVHAQEPPLNQRRIIINFLSVPIDHAWIRVQYLDNIGRVLSSLTRRSTNVFDGAVDKYAEMLFEPIESGPLACLFWYFDGDNVYESGDVVVESVRPLLLEMSLQISFFFDGVKDFPNLFVALGDESRPRSERLEIGQRFRQKPQCCREPGCEDKVYNSFESAEAMVDDLDFRDLWQNCDRVSRLSSMQVERLLAQIKAAIRERHRPEVERVCAGGLLTQWNAEHLAAGGSSAKFTTIKELWAHGGTKER